MSNSQLLCRGKDMKAIACHQAQLAHAGTQLQHQPLIFDEAQVFVLAELEEGPFLIDFLLLTVDELLNLLRLGVGLDQGTRSDGLGISELLGAALDDVEDGVDAFFRVGLEPVKGGGMSTRDGLALDGFDALDFDAEGRFLDQACLEDLPVVCHGDCC